MKTMWNRIFVICVVLVVILNFTAIIYTNDYGRQYSVLELLFMDGYREILWENGISFVSAWRQISPYSTMFFPVLAIFPYINYNWTERNSGNVVFVVNRIGYKKYLRQCIVKAMLSSGIVVMLGYLLFALLAVVLFPGVQEEIGVSILIVTLLKKMLSMFAYGMVIATPTLFFSSFLKNRYVICCIPFICIYCYDLIAKRCNGWQSITITYIEDVPGPIPVLAVYVVVAGFFVCAFYWIMRRRGKFGEI